MKKIAIIGASTGQIALCKKAKQYGIYTICFAWKDGAICDKLVDKFYPISIDDVDSIVEICKREKVDGIATNGSDFTAEKATIIANEIGLIANPLNVFETFKNKYNVRKISNDLQGFSKIKFYLYEGQMPDNFPVVVKPIVGGGKKGVSYAENRKAFLKAVDYGKSQSDEILIVEQFINGREISVESLSYNGTHYVVQITDKESTGAPHFVEIGHHQPALLSLALQNRIKKCINELLTAVGYMNGATHIELKIDANDNIYLIEMNMRGGGDEISNQLVELSTGYDYIKGIIDISLGVFNPPAINNKMFSGIFFLCEQTKKYLNYFIAESSDLVVDKHILSVDLTQSTSNRDRNGYVVYQSDHKIRIDEISKKII